MSDIAAAFIIQYLDQFDNIVKQHNILYKYAASILPPGIEMFPHSDNDTPFVSCLALLMDPDRSIKAQKILNDHHIFCRKYYNPLLPLPVSVELFNSILCVPLHKDMTCTDINTIFLHLNSIINVADI
jgi:dTDP-4-amino-4,6-dideoxygalactose transaminase